MTEKVTNETILNEIKKFEQELKAQIEAVEAKVLLKIEEVNSRANEVEKQILELTNRIEKVEVKSKENNIIIFGLKKAPHEITLDLVSGKIKELLDIDIQESDINNFFPLGNKEGCPIKIEFISYLKKAQIFKNVKKLKGTNISISHDMTEKQRLENQILRRQLHKARQNKDSICYIKKNKLHIDNKIYTPQELKKLEYCEGNVQAESISPPSTPTTSTASTAVNELPILNQTILRATQQKAEESTKQDSSKKKKVKETTNVEVVEERKITRSRK